MRRRVQPSTKCIGYTGETDTARIEVWDNRDGTLSVIIVGKDSEAEWTVTNAEARQIIQGLVTVL